jgi:serine/threonine protein kinase
VGTVFYLSPEQALGRALDGRADLYAFGVMLYELSCGRLPFSGDDPLTVISQHLHAPVVPPSSTVYGAAVRLSLSEHKSSRTRFLLEKSFRRFSMLLFVRLYSLYAER